MSIRPDSPGRSLAPPRAPGVRQGLDGAAGRMEALGVDVPPRRGKLYRPLMALGLVPPERRHGLESGFWLGALAIQMAHEASLLHDDVVDGADLRRGEPTLVARAGVAAALVQGDRWLTGAYRAAAEAGLPAFLHTFVEAVDRTVAGEMEQGRRAGRRLDPEEWEAVARSKSGALFGAGGALGAYFLGRPDEADRRRSVAEDVGVLYQMVDDLLDYCPGADAGKPPLQDYRQGKWTWLPEITGLPGLGLPPGAVLEHLFTAHAGGSTPMRRALAHLQARAAGVTSAAAELAPGDDTVGRVVDGWLRAAARGVDLEEARVDAPAVRVG